jgi:hypothetical protein
MNREFAQRIEEYLSSECEEYGLEYKWEWNEDTRCCEATITNSGQSKELNFRFERRELQIELSEDSFYETAEYNSSVKYFWMLICPVLFAKN